ncbi:MAG TPA: hypothetical protein DER01_11140 [Phycisphaerales bacterium]|nr:hypothetical protein [Phycisphaerales bacterium]
MCVLFEAHCKQQCHELDKGAGERKLPGQQILVRSLQYRPTDFTDEANNKTTVIDLTTVV